MQPPHLDSLVQSHERSREHPGSAAASVTQQTPKRFHSATDLPIVPLCRLPNQLLQDLRLVIPQPFLYSIECFCRSQTSVSSHLENKRVAIESTKLTERILTSVDFEIVTL